MNDLIKYIEESLLDDLSDLEKNADAGVDNAHKKQFANISTKYGKLDIQVPNPNLKINITKTLKSEI